MNKEVNIKTLVAIIVIAGLILGTIIVFFTNKFSKDMAQIVAPMRQEHSHLNSL